MTDLFRGYDLTTVADEVARKAYERNAAHADAERTPWDEVPALAKHALKSSLLPLITDVLEALESDQVKPTEARQMVEYDYINADRSDPRWYENQDHQHDVTTATVWTLHLHVHERYKDAVLERMSVLPEPTGEYTWGDSWRQWCEPAEGDHDTRLGIYFHATPERAKAIAEHLADHATFAGDATIPAWTLTTSGDYAEVRHD